MAKHGMKEPPIWIALLAVVAFVVVGTVTNAIVGVLVGVAMNFGLELVDLKVRGGYNA